MPHTKFIDNTVQKTNIWLHHIREVGGWQEDTKAWGLLRATLHQLRDNLPIEAAAHLSAQLPMLIRGLFFEDWRPALCPLKERTQDEFLFGLAAKLDDYGHPDVDPEFVSKAIFATLWAKISEGEMLKLCRQLPKGIRNLLLDSAITEEQIL